MSGSKATQANMWHLTDSQAPSLLNRASWLQLPAGARVLQQRYCRTRMHVKVHASPESAGVYHFPQPQVAHQEAREGKKDIHAYTPGQDIGGWSLFAGEACPAWRPAACLLLVTFIVRSTTLER